MDIPPTGRSTAAGCHVDILWRAAAAIVAATPRLPTGRSTWTFRRRAAAPPRGATYAGGILLVARAAPAFQRRKNQQKRTSSRRTKISAPRRSSPATRLHRISTSPQLVSADYTAHCSRPRRRRDPSAKCPRGERTRRAPPCPRAESHSPSRRCSRGTGRAPSCSSSSCAAPLRGDDLVQLRKQFERWRRRRRLRRQAARGRNRRRRTAAAQVGLPQQRRHTRPCGDVDAFALERAGAARAVARAHCSHGEAKPCTNANEAAGRELRIRLKKQRLRSLP